LTKLTIQWQIGNQCNFRCDYCHPDLYGGSNPFLDYDQFQKGLNNLDLSVTNYDLVEIEFQGGEPTISTSVRNKIIDSDNRYRYVLMTNASADLEWWAKAAPKFNSITLAYHTLTDINHFCRVVDLLKANNVAMNIVVNADPNNWSNAVNVHKQFKDSTATEFRALYANYQRGSNVFLNYDQEQWAYYTEVNKIAVPEDQPVEVQIQWVEQNLYDNYKGHLCWAGVDQIVIDYFGYVYRGWCHAHGAFGNIFDSSVVLDAKPRACPRDLCKNLFDQQARKSNNSWGIG
jgi:sulfatase maturation enzyme AslB (radical SAM superfamily)